MIILGIIFSVAAAWFCSRLSRNRRRKLLILLAVFFAGSEIGKQILLYVWNDRCYIWWYFPFQLCSMHLYLLPAALLLYNPFENCTRFPDYSGIRMQLQRTVFTFLADFGTLAGIFVFVDTTGMQYQLPILTVHSYLWHFLMIFTGVLLGFSAEPEYSGRFFPGCAVFLTGAGIAELINFLFHNYGSINMFYISPWEPVTQAVFRDIAEKTGDGLCHIIYLAVIIMGAGIVHLVFKTVKYKLYIS